MWVNMIYFGRVPEVFIELCIMNLSFEGLNNQVDKGDLGDTWVSRRPLTRFLIKDFLRN